MAQFRNVSHSKGAIEVSGHQELIFLFGVLCTIAIAKLSLNQTATSDQEQ